MSDPPPGKQSKKSQLLRPFKGMFSRSYSRSPSPAPPYQGAQSVTPHNASASISASSTNRATSAPQVYQQGTEYTAILELSTTPSRPLTWEHRMKEWGGTTYEGLKMAIQGIHDFSGSFPPLQTTAGVLLAISKVVDRVSANRTDLEQLGVKLQSILSIISKYRENDGLRALDYRVEHFCLAIDLQIDALEKLCDNSLWTRTLEGTKDADTVLKVFRNISSLCDVFQIDTQLHTEVKVEEIFKRLESRSIDKLNHEMTSYKTRNSSYGNPTGCMAGTRVKILKDLEAWASDDLSSKVYWLVGMAGTGKSTILHTLCEILDAKNMLGGSFFCSRGSENTRNARLIVPTIAYSLASISPCIKSEVIKAIENDPKLAEPTYINLVNQFKKLIHDPVHVSVGNVVKTYKIIVIDAVDECTDLQLVSLLIQLILESTSTIPLKVFIASRDESLIRRAFTSLPRLRTSFYLHEADKDVVKDDIRIYLESSLAKIKADHGRTLDTLDIWPPPSEVSALLNRSGTLFIFAATAIRYISQGGPLYKSRLSAMANQDIKSVSKLQTSTIDSLYGRILDQACESKEESEVVPMRQLVSMIVFLRNPLPIQAISSLSEIDAHLYLLPLTSVIHVPTYREAAVTPFHASFPDFVTDPTRCSCKCDPPFRVLVASECHEMLALKCLEQMNRSLKYNICKVPKELTVSCRETTNSPDNSKKISEALKYSCIYWATHFSEAQVSGVDLIDALDIFLHKHLLHWIECLSELGELQTGISSLRSVATALSRFKQTNIQCHSLQLLADDGRKCLQMNFACIQKHSFEIYESALVWLPKKSLIRNVYATDIRRVSRVIAGLLNLWGPTELHMYIDTAVHSIAFSQDGSQVVSGSVDKIVRIWNTTTGEVEAELKGHMDFVTSVAFSQDGSQVVSGSVDGTVRIWNTMTGEIEAVLKSYMSLVSSVAFSHDGSRVVSGSYEGTVRIWNAMTGEVEAELKGYVSKVLSVVFSQDGSQLASGSCDIVRIWNTMTGEVKAEQQKQMKVSSIAFSQDGSRVAYGLYRTVKICNTMMGEVEAELKGHKDAVTSVAFSQDGSRVVSGSSDNTVRIWNIMTGEVEAVLKGHLGGVDSVAFVQDGSRVASGSRDGTIRIWNTTSGEVKSKWKGHTDVATSLVFDQNGSQDVCGSQKKHTAQIRNMMRGEIKPELKGHTSSVMCIAFAWDGSRVVSGSDDKTARIWNTTTGEVEAELKGHMDTVMSVAFSQDGSRVVSGSADSTGRIWNTTSGEVEAELTGHKDIVASIAFSQDGSQVVSGSYDKTVRIWNVRMGKVEAELMGHVGNVTSVAFSQDGSRVVSGSYDGTGRVWNMRTGEVEAELKIMGWVRFIAFSWDGSQVVSGLHDKTVQIWNAATGELQLKTTATVTLPDNSTVHNTGNGNVHISYPGQSTLSISHDCQWIMGAFHDCWIPSHNRDFVSSSFFGDRVCLGYPSGNMIIFDMKASP